MKRLLSFLLMLLVAVPAQAQILPSGAQRVQGADDPAVNRGYPVRVMSVDTTGTYAPSASGGTANAASPTYVEAATAQPLSLDLHGGLRILNMAADGTVLDTSGAVPVVGAAVHDAAISGAPVRLGARALTSDYTAVATGDTADLKTTLTGALITRQDAIPEAEWSYAAAASGISNTTTAVTIKAAAAAGIRNYVRSCQISSDALGAATEFAIRDGAGGTVLWRTKIGTAGYINGYTVTFSNPLRGTAATLLEVVTLTASVTGAVYVNCQGYIAP